MGVFEMRMLQCVNLVTPERNTSRGCTKQVAELHIHRAGTSEAAFISMGVFTHVGTQKLFPNFELKFKLCLVNDLGDYLVCFSFFIEVFLLLFVFSSFLHIPFYSRLLAVQGK